MPIPSIGLWSFVKELFLNKQSLTDYIRRNKLFSLLIVSNTTLFIFLLFITEQAIQHQERAVHFKGETDRLMAENVLLKDKTRELDSCQLRLSTLAKSKVVCPTAVTNPTPNPRPARHKPDPDPIIVPRSYSDDTLRHKLDTLR